MFQSMTRRTHGSGFSDSRKRAEPGFGGTAALKRAPGFTLIELLTVIAIIGILAAILIPVVSRVRESAISSKCQSNLREIGIAAHMYAADHDDFFPPTRPSNLSWLEPEVRDAFDYYLDGSYEVFYCPNSLRYENDPAVHHDAWNEPAHRGGYGIGYYYLGNPSVPGFGQPSTYWVDSRGTRTIDDEYLVRATDPDASIIALAADQSGQIGRVGDNWVMRHPVSESGNMNVLYGDGHVQSKSANEIKLRYHPPEPIGW